MRSIGLIVVNMDFGDVKNTFKYIFTVALHGTDVLNFINVDHLHVNMLNSILKTVQLLIVQS